MTENTLISLTVPSGWTIVSNNLLCIDLTQLDPDDLKQVVDIYYDYQVFGAIFSGSNRAPRHSVSIYVHCSLLDMDDYLKGFNYDLSYFLVNRGKIVPESCVDKQYNNINDLVDNLNKLLIKVHYDIDIIVKKNSLDY